ncbi:DUF2399 domain-containing protein [Streptomyces sp. NPDC048430]|uniref:DUF2399 domain-containing protein n=1 Tax=Streptomyces sp. NPDC048430 TaxID=3155388 RepID=UPI00343F85F1
MSNELLALVERGLRELIELVVEPGASPRRTGWIDLRRYQPPPGRITADDYERLAAAGQAEEIPQLPLDDRPVDADWDPGLAPGMAALGVALKEEATLDLLVGDLFVSTQ